MVAFLEPTVLTTRPARVIPCGAMFAAARWSAVLTLLTPWAAESYMYQKGTQERRREIVDKRWKRANLPCNISKWEVSTMQIDCLTARLPQNSFDC